MVDDTPKNPQSIRVERISADRSETNEMHVDRFRVGTNDQMDAQSDLLLEIAALQEDQTKTLNGTLHDVENAVTDLAKAIRQQQGNLKSEFDLMRRDLRATLGFLRGGGGGGGGPGGGGGGGTGGGGGDRMTTELIGELERLRRAIEVSATQAAVEAEGGGQPGKDFADVRAAQVQIDDFRKIMEETNFGMTRFNRLLGSGVFTTFRENIDRLNLSIQNFGERMTRFENVTGFFSDRFNTYLEASGASLLDFQDVMFNDFLPALQHGGDNLVDTFNTIRSAVQSGLISPIGFFGAEVTDVARTFRDVRGSIIEDMGFDLFDRMGFREANEAMVGLFETQRRANIQADIRGTATQLAITRQLNALDVIAQNTGQTVEELVKATQEDRRQISDLVASGILEATGGAGFSQLINYLKTTGRGTLAEVVLNVARAGGSVEAFFANNPDLAQAFAATNNVDQLRALIGMTQRGGLDALSFGQLTDQIARGFTQNTGFLGVAGGQVLTQQFQQLLGEVNLTRDAITRRREGDESTVAGLFRRVQDFFTNVFPSSTGALVFALAANTAALFANTAAIASGRLTSILGGGLGGLLRRIPGARMIGGLGRAAAGGLAAAGGMAGAASMTGAKAIGGLLKGGIKSILKKIPIIGLGAGLLFGAHRAFQGDFAGAAGEVLSGGASMLPGVGTAASLAIDAGLAARDISRAGDAAEAAAVAGPVAPTLPTPTQSPGSAQDRQAMMVMMRRQSDALEEMAALMRESNDINSDVRRNTSRIGLQERGLFGDAYALFSGDDASP